MSVNIDSQYQNLPRKHLELEHLYGDNVHIISSPVLMTALARVCSEEIRQPETNRMFAELYTDLLKVMANAQFPRTISAVQTRMRELTDQGVYHGETLDRKTKVAIAAVARAGVLPAHILFDRLNLLLDPAGVRIDYFFVARTTDDEDHVNGAEVSCHKIGGPIDDAILVLPDPMGATGSSMIQTLDTYKQAKSGTPTKKIAMHLIVTPEYLAAMREQHPDVIIYAIRLDRGLSSPEVLATIPGTHWDKERGLTDNQYIVPGGGGIGEVMTNSWV